MYMGSNGKDINYKNGIKIATVQEETKDNLFGKFKKNNKIQSINSDYVELHRKDEYFEEGETKF